MPLPNFKQQMKLTFCTHFARVIKIGKAKRCSIVQLKHDASMKLIGLEIA